MRLARSLKIALAVMVILGTLFMAAPSDARRGHHGRWGGHYWGGYHHRHYGYYNPYYSYCRPYPHYYAYYGHPYRQ
jgi:hypothetical protein